MEKHFASATGDALPEKTGSSSKRSRFSEGTLPDSASTVASPISPNMIRQTSTGGTSGGIWDQPFMIADTDPKSNDWGAGLPGVSSFASPSAAVSSNTALPNMGSPANMGALMPGAGTLSNPLLPGSGFTAPGAYFNPSMHFNTESGYHASPSADSQANSSSISNSMFDPNAVAAAYGMATGNGQGYYNPSMTPFYGNPNGMNPYAMGAMNGMGTWAMNPYGAGQGGMGMDDMGMNGDMQNPVTLQAWYQQELLRHRRSLEKEEEEEARAAEAEEAARSEWSSKRLMPVKVSSPLAETLWAGVKTMSVLNTPDGPDRGVGMPLANRSWLDRPYYAGLFVGNMWGSKLVSGLIDQDDGGNGGLLLGYNFNEYWGVESRFHFASLDIYETAEGKIAYEDWYRSTNEIAADATVPPLSSRSHRLTMFDFSVHYYPLGNAKWRPFFKYGLGISRGSFVDTYGTKHTSESMTMPIGFGLRYWWNDRLAIQTDIVDNMIFSEGIAKTQNNWTLSIGISYAFGTGKKRRPVPYWPYTPSTGSKF